MTALRRGQHVNVRCRIDNVYGTHRGIAEGVLASGRIRLWVRDRLIITDSRNVEPIKDNT